MIRRILAVVLSILVLAPAGAFAQASRAGVVTTLEGNVSARRVALPGPLPLKFKDEVFLQDTVTTGDKSLARMLLGGKAVVTVRERSVITITEVPGRSTLELETGKFALAVAREKMRPGEEIQIRTPNAVAGVRGTVVITEVNRQSAQAGGAAPAVLTNFYVLRGSISAQRLDPGTRQPVGAPLQVGTMQAYSGAGTATPSVAPVPPEQVGQITSGLSPSGPKGGSDAGSEQVKAQQVQTAVALLTTLTGGGSAILAQTSPLPSTITADQNSSTAPLTSTTNNADALEDSVALAGQLQLFTAFSGLTTLTEPAQTFSTSFSSTSPNAVLQLMDATIVQLGDFIVLLSGANVSLAGPLVTFVNSGLLATGSLFEMQGGSLASTSTNPLIDLDPSIVTAGDAVIALNGGTVTLAGALFTDTNGVVVATGPLLRMQGGVALTSTGTAALITLDGTTIATAGGLSMTNATMQLAGPLVSATGITGAGGITSPGGAAPIFALDASTITSTGTGALIQFASTETDNDDNFLRLANGSTINLAGSLLKFTDTLFEASEVARSFIAVLNGSKIVTSGTNEPLLAFTGTSSGATRVKAARNFFTLAFNTTTTSPSMSLSGPFLSATNAEFKTGDPTTNTFTFLFIGDGAQVASTSASPFMTFTNSSLDTAGDVLTIRRSVAGMPSRLTLAGPLLVASGSTFNHTSLGFGAAFSTSASACCGAFFIGQGGHLTSTSTNALIQLTNSTVTGNDAQSGGHFFHVADTFSGAPAAEFVGPSTVALAGPLVQATNSTITSLFNLIRVQRSSLSSTSSSPLVDITGGSVTLGGTNAATGGAALGNLLSLQASSTSGQAESPASVTLSGPLARITGATFAAGAGNIVTVSNGATYTSSGAGAILQLTNSTLTGFNLLSASGIGGTGGTGAATVSLTGPLLSASGSTTTLGRNVLFNSGSFTSTGTGALVSVSGGSLTTGTSSTDGAVMMLNGASPGLVTLNGPVLSMGSSAALTASGALLAAFNGGRLVVNTSTDPLFAFAGGTHSFGTASGTDRDAALILNGLAAETMLESIDVLTQGSFCDGPCEPEADTVSVTRGTRQPVQHGGTLLDATGGTYTTNKIMRLDTALLEASAPIITLKSGATVTVSTDALDLTQAAKLTTTSTTSLVSLSGSGTSLTITSGALIAARLGSFLNVGGTAIQVSGGASLVVSNGVLLLATGNSVVKIAGALVNFGTGGGTVSVTNDLCLSSCVIKGGLKFSLGPGANSNNIAVGSGAVTGGSIALSSNGAHARVEGANTRVNIGNFSE